MATIQQLESALVKADAAGDAEGARALAGEIRRMRSTAPAPANTPPDSSTAPSYPAVIGNALNKGIAGAADMVGNLGHNIVNLGKAAYGAGAYALGRPDIGDNVQMMETPDLARKGMEKLNLIRPEAEPQTTGQRIVDSAGQGVGGMALGPAAGLPGLARNAVMGAVSGGDAGLVREATGNEALATATSMLTPSGVRGMARNGREKVAAAMQNRSANAVRDENLMRAREEGYVVPPSHVNPSVMNKAMESLAGKADVKQDMSLRNQHVTNRLANRDLGLKEDTALTEGHLDSIRKESGKAYESLADMPYLPGIHAGEVPPGQALGQLRQYRSDATQYFKEGNRSGSKDAQDKAHAAQAKAEDMERLLERHAERSGNEALVDAMRESRTTIAKTHDIEKNLNPGDANINALGLRDALKNGRPLTGGLETIARFASSFPQVARETAKVPSPGVSKLNAFLGGAGGVGGTVAFGPAIGIPLAALPFASGAARAAIATPYYQRHFATPNYGQGKYMSMIPDATDREMQLQAAIIGAIQARKQQGKE